MGLSRGVFDYFVMYISLYHRWFFVILLLPASLLYNFSSFLIRRGRYVLRLRRLQKHDDKVNKIQKQVKAWKASNSDKKMCTDRRGFANLSFRFSLYKKDMAGVNVDMSDILRVNPENRTVIVEPSVTIGEITASLLPSGWSIPIVPELEDLTVGGLINGIGLETSSHLHGLFKDTCISFDIVTADGEVLHCSETENKDLFYAVPFSHGTLGFMVAAELKIIPIKQFVRLEYLPTYSVEETVKVLKECSLNRSYDFVEGLMFSESTGVVMNGKFQDPTEGDTVNRLGYWWKPWFYCHVSEFLNTGKAVEFIPTADYYRRHTRSFFWLMRDIIPFADHWWFRFFFGWASPPNVQLLKFTMTRTISKMYENSRMVQDMLVPVDFLEKTLLYIFKNVRVFPLWLCPFLCYNKPGFVHPSIGKDELYVDVGTYGRVGISDFHPIECTRAYEAFVRRAHGHQMPYADSYQTREEFAQMFDRSLYDTMRRKLPNCMNAFPDIFDKTTRAARS